MPPTPLFLLSLANIFSIYPQVFKELFNGDYDDDEKVKKRSNKRRLHLPSDNQWQTKVYYRLLEIQKKINAALQDGISFEDTTATIDKPVWDPLEYLERVSPALSSTSSSPQLAGRGNRKKCVQDHAIEYIDINLLGSWSLQTIANAGKLLRKPPIPVHFEDEHEMRKVYSLIYDVFRYKHVLSQTLNDVGFFGRFPDMKASENRVWLLLFELYSRHFLRRSSEDALLEEKLFREADLDVIADCLWDLKIRLAAAISRLRIKSKAIHLSHLLPAHLQNEKVAIAAANPIVTGWMNPFKIKDKDNAVTCLDEMGLQEVNQEESLTEKPLLPNQYKWDKICPLFMSCLPNDRNEFAKSELVKNHLFVMQDRTFSIAPAIVSRLLDHFQLDGDIVQTHVSSPRSTAYLAALFYSVNRVNDFLAFGAGQCLEEYQDYIKTLGVNNVRLYPESFCSVPIESPILETVVGIFATPPNSFSGIADPIDLICSRGGDLSMLEVLTESEISKEGKIRVAQILKEQRETLRLAMSRPQVQFVLYETHSIVGSENQDMVEKSVEIINRCAFEKHLAAYKERIKIEAQQQAESSNFPAAAMTATSSASLASSRKRAAGTPKETGNRERSLSRLRVSSKVSDSIDPESSTTSSQKVSIASQQLNTEKSEDSEDFSNLVEVPQTDEFLIADVPDICLNRDNCMDFSSMGCYVSLIQRKQITSLDAKYLIKMAEARGLFGNSDDKKLHKSRSARKLDKKQETAMNVRDKTNKNPKNDMDQLINRISQPTHASYIRSNLQRVSLIERQMITFNSKKRDCERHSRHSFFDIPNTFSQLDTRAKRWWRETTNYINELRNSQDFISPKNLSSIDSSHRPASMPPLHLTRQPIEAITSRYRNTKVRPKDNVIPYPVTVIHLEFGCYTKVPNKQLNDAYKFNPFYHTKNIQTFNKSEALTNRSLVFNKKSTFGTQKRFS